MGTEERHLDCIIIGAGISGLDAAYHLQEHCKWASYVVLERRANLGGTWDLNRDQLYKIGLPGKSIL